MKKYIMDRRQFLRYLVYGGLFTAGQPLLSACRPLLTESPTNEFLNDPDVEIRLVAKPDVQQIFPGPPTKIWHYRGEVLKGPSDTLTLLQESYLGPTFRVKPGMQLRIHFDNELPEQSIVHWHGLHVPDDADGHPRLAVGSGETYIYNFRVMDRAGTYWYHPHPHGRTGPQVYGGLAGLFLVHDDEEAALDLPTGNKDLPIVIQDRLFDSENQLIYNSSGMGMMSQMLGMLGDEILVNGLPDSNIAVERSAYRLRLMNGSNARIYKLAWSDGTPLHVIGTDGGLLEKPVVRDYITLAPAQRIDVWVDFGSWEPGTSLRMVNLPAMTPDGGSEFPIFTASIKDTARQDAKLPETLTLHEVLNPVQAVNANSPRVFTLQMGRGMRWQINGRQFEMNDVARDEKVQLGDTELWEFYNQGGVGMGMGMMSQPHPMHVHGLQFKVIERWINPGEESAYQTLKNGFVDEGWHDTVLVMPGERVRIMMQFKDFSGLYLYHCHILEHEDMGMMRNYQVK